MPIIGDAWVSRKADICIHVTQCYMDILDTQSSKGNMLAGNLGKVSAERAVRVDALVGILDYLFQRCGEFKR
jgi:hypothetical protein